MNAKTLFTAAFAFACATAGMAISTSAMAGEATPDHPMLTLSSVSRAEVRAAAEQSRAAGQITFGNHELVTAAAGVGKTRVQVVAETLEAIRLGAIDRHEASSSPTPAQLNSIDMAGRRALQMTVAAR